MAEKKGARLLESIDNRDARLSWVLKIVRYSPSFCVFSGSINGRYGVSHRVAAQELDMVLCSRNASVQDAIKHSIEQLRLVGDKA